MDAKNLFDAEAYFRDMAERNRLARENDFRFCTCSGIESLQGPIEMFTDAPAFFCLDDTNDGVMFRGRSGGWFLKRTFTVFVMKRYDFNDEPSRIAALAVCRRLMQQVASRMIVDAADMSNELVYLHVDNILSRELGQYFLNGCTGLYFMIDVSEPVNLTYDTDEWQK